MATRWLSPGTRRLITRRASSTQRPATARPGLPGASSSRHASTWLGPLDLQLTYRLPPRRNADQQLRPEADLREDTRAEETWPCEGVGGQLDRRLLD